MFRRMFLASALAGAALVAGGSLRADEARKPEGKPIDVIICLDTSNSMDGLIAAAKLKLWDIVNDLARARPTPNLRVGLYSYGNDTYDAKIGWVRKELDLSTDLDTLYQKLNGLTTNGGTEYVGRVCRDALSQAAWSADRNALKIIFVCGNEPASQDPVVKLTDLANLSKEMGVFINPIYCGGANDSQANDWKELARLAGGRFNSIDQDRGTVAIATPFDKELEKLGAGLNQTYCAFGKAEFRQEKALNQQLQDANAAKASPVAAAARAATKASALYRNSDWDLVDRIKEDPKFDIKKVPVEELNDELKKLKPEEREKHVKDLLVKREALQKQISDLNVKRTQYIQAEMKKNAGQAGKAFDAALKACIREQAAVRGLEIPE